jgi:hypothetical protein
MASTDGLGGPGFGTSRVGTLLRSLVQFFFQPVAISDVQHVKLLELVEQLLRRSRIVTVTLPFGDDLALVRNMPLGLGNVPLSLRQMVQYQGSVWHTGPTPAASSRSGALGKPAGAFVVAAEPSGFTYDVFGDTLVKRAYRATDIRRSDQTLAEFTSRLSKIPLAYQPGSTWEYSISTDVLGRVIQAASRFHSINLFPTAS